MHDLVLHIVNINSSLTGAVLLEKDPEKAYPLETIEVHICNECIILIDGPECCTPTKLA